MRLLSSQGELVRGRCRSTNLCGYCAVQFAHENARMLSLDAMEGDAPAIVAIVGTRTATGDPKPFYQGREKVVLALRRRWPAAQYASQVEFTTGKGARAAGERRPHWNLLLKGIPAEDVDQARDVVRRIWCQHVDAVPEAQYVEQLQSTAAFMRYVALHFAKQSQAPPEGWSGQRFNASRAYFTGRSRAEARVAARESLAVDRAAWRAAQAGLEGDEAAAAVSRELSIREATTWRLLDVTRMVTAASRQAQPGGPPGAGLQRSPTSGGRRPQRPPSEPQLDPSGPSATLRVDRTGGSAPPVAIPAGRDQEIARRDCTHKGTTVTPRSQQCLDVLVANQATPEASESPPRCALFD